MEGAIIGKDIFRWVKLKEKILMHLVIYAESFCVLDSGTPFPNAYHVHVNVCYSPSQNTEIRICVLKTFNQF
jgi:hypothetical protein